MIPYVDWDLGKTETDSVRIPATRAEFVQMARYEFLVDVQRLL